MQTAEIFGEFTDKRCLADALRVTTRSIDRWSSLPNGLPYIRLGRTRLFSSVSAREWLKAREHQPNPRRANA
jgi:hypothetical protein